MKKTAFIAGIALGISGLSTFAVAHSGATGVVMERMEKMKMMGDVVKSLSAMMRGETTYDPAAVRKGAAVIRSHSGDALTDLFPEGSLQEVSEAKPAIWSDWQTFSNLADQLGTFAEGLEAAADNGLMAGGTPGAPDGQADMMTGSGTMMGGGMTGNGSMMMGNAPAEMDVADLAQMPADAVFNMTVQTCSACHTKFRIEKQ
ncbi:c-type cytochrome [Roseibium salinum]|uniref:Cytochrome c n=2 Tax=Roseibium salinum TaxID=1604349 RepID=A0ABT3R999_9HYPH|nr:cytochrome c [Roseibium sp. DSM 29163]MCX2725732.1 cytochrome c [Roseibium sp. DSM 29163]